MIKNPVLYLTTFKKNRVHENVKSCNILTDSIPFKVLYNAVLNDFGYAR